MGYKSKAYVAGPFFNKTQVEIVERVKKELDKLGIEYYSPKDECLYTPENDITPAEVFMGNIKAIMQSDFIIAITDGKDTGTMFEAGFGWGMRIPILYIWVNHNHQPFNIMLAESASYVAYGYKEMSDALKEFKASCAFPKYRLKGAVE